LIERGTTWFLRSRRLTDDMAATIGLFTPRAEAPGAMLPELLDSERSTRLAAAVDSYVAKGVPQPVAARVVALEMLYSTLDIVEVGRCDEAAGRARRRDLFRAATALELPWLREMIARSRRTSTGRSLRATRCRTTCPGCSGRSPARFWRRTADSRAR
jgi:glutamate dehydrogenase